MGIDFTSGEKRGLIALLALLAIVLCLSIIMRMCSATSSYSVTDLNSNGRDSARTDVRTTPASDSAVIIYPKEKRRTRTKKQTTKQTRPDGRERSFLDEPVGQ